MGMIGHYLRITPGELAAIERAPETLPDLVYRDDLAHAGRIIDVDKAWHAIHWLLKQHRDADDELSNVVLGGETLGDVDLGMGPARAIAAPDVAAMATVLQNISAGDLRQRWDAQELQERAIYPNIWNEGDDALDYVLLHYAHLVQFFAAAARAGDAIITWIA